MASMRSGEAEHYLNDFSLAGIGVAKVSEVLSLFIVVVYRTAEHVVILPQMQISRINVIQVIKPF